MSKKHSSVPIIIQSKKVSELANEYSVCITKTASSILELANVVFRANTDLNKEEYELFRVQINAGKSKDSYLRKLHRIAQKASRLDSIKEKLPAAYTTLYALTQLTDAEFQQAIAEDAISPDLIASDLSKFKTKSTKQVATSTNLVSLSLQSASSLDMKKVLTELEKLCTTYSIKFKCNYDFTAQVHPSNEDCDDCDFREINTKYIELTA
jgi:hypothetical protein